MYPQDYNTYPSQAQIRMPYQQQQQQPYGVNLRMAQPVSSLEEVKAMAIPFDGSIFFFPDLASKRVYTKQVLQDGTPNYKVYEEKSLPNINMASSYVTREEYEKTLMGLQTTLGNIMNSIQGGQPQAQPQAQPTETNTEVKPF